MAFNRREVIFDYQGEEEEKQYNTHKDDQTEGMSFTVNTYLLKSYRDYQTEGKMMEQRRRVHVISTVVQKGAWSTTQLFTKSENRGKMVLNGKKMVFLIAKGFIPPFTRITIDYSVRWLEENIVCLLW